jgi:hypothetical protein
MDLYSERNSLSLLLATDSSKVYQAAETEYMGLRRRALLSKQGKTLNLPLYRLGFTCSMALIPG